VMLARLCAECDLRVGPTVARSRSPGRASRHAPRSIVRATSHWSRVPFFETLIATRSRTAQRLVRLLCSALVCSEALGTIAGWPSMWAVCTCANSAQRCHRPDVGPPSPGLGRRLGREQRHLAIARGRASKTRLCDGVFGASTVRRAEQLDRYGWLDQRIAGRRRTCSLHRACNAARLKPTRLRGVTRLARTRR